MNIIFIAPPASGKGTQSEYLQERYNYLHLSTGDLLRSEINNKSELGTKIESIISKGELVSDEIITDLLKNKLENIGHQKFILDGFPRTKSQAISLDNIFKELSFNDYLVIYLKLDSDIALKRALGRMVCSNCGASYNKYFQNLMPKENGICDKCQTKLTHRTDDNEESFKNRFETFLELTNPVLGFYKEKNKLCTIDANQSADVIFKDIEQFLKSEDVNN